MLAYAPRAQRHRPNPPALVLIIAAHAAALVAVMSARMSLPEKQRDPPIFVDSIELPPPPTPPKPPENPTTAPPQPSFSAPQPFVPMPPMPGPVVEPLPQPQPGPAVGIGTGPAPVPIPAPIVRKGPRFATSPDAVRPPYPDAMRAAEREAVLRLRLSIDERGRVIAVEPVGKAEPAFLAAARRHILRAWRYSPAIEGDRAIASTTVITLEFRLDS